MNVNSHFDAYRFYETYAAIPEEGYVAWYSYPDARAFGALIASALLLPRVLLSFCAKTMRATFLV